MIAKFGRSPLLLFAFFTLATVSRPEGLSPSQNEKVERAIGAFMQKERVPGLSAAIALDGKLVWSRGFGFADLENEVPVTTASVFRLASICKMITATATLQLAERGKLDLDAPIQKYCRNFPEKPWPITTRLLLCHQSGIRHYEGGESLSTAHFLEIESTLNAFKDEPLLFEPGTKYSYTTYGYNVVGCVIEGASGGSYDEYMKKHIFEPAGMEHTQRDDPYVLIMGRAQGYRKPIDPKGPFINGRLADVTNKVPGGGLCSTAEDLAKFAIALQAGRLVKKETLEMMRTAQKTKDGKETPVGYGSFIGRRGDRRVISHSGGQPRVSTFLHMEPDQHLAIALLTNLEGLDLASIARSLAEISTPGELPASATPTN